MDSPDYYKSVNKSISQLYNLRTKDYLHNFQFLKFNRPFINFPDLCHPASPCRSGWGDPRERRGVGSPLPPPPSPPQGVCSLSHIGILKSSVVDPFHFDTDPDPDPRIRFRWLRIRIRICGSGYDYYGSGSGSWPNLDKNSKFRNFLTIFWKKILWITFVYQKTL